MKCTFTNQTLHEAPPEYTRVELTEGGVFRYTGEALQIGVGKWAEVTPRKFILVCRQIIQKAKENKVRKIAVQMNRSPFPQLAHLPLPELASRIAQNFEMANFTFNAFKTPPPEGFDTVEEVLVCGETPAEMQKGFLKGQIIGEGVNACRTLSNTPGGDMTPTKLAEAAEEAAKGLPIEVTILGREQIERLGMGAVVGVAKGSSEEPKFIILEYKGSEGQPASPETSSRGGPIVLVGKGVTFDSGGLNIKTEGHMYEMHMDMSGGAAAIMATITAARLALPKHVVALVPAVENMSAGNAVRPGDILKSLSGKTIEVTDTDAEGRLILSDALTYAKRFNPSVVLDTATLTGSSMSALGLRATALLTRDDALAEQIAHLGEESGDYVWRLPLWDEYEENIKGTFADLVNIPESKDMQRGDVINAAMFLWQFAKELDCPWAHLDMAPRMTSIKADALARGAAGTPVRLFVKFVEQWTP